MREVHASSSRPLRLDALGFGERNEGLGRLRSFVFRMDEPTRVKWASVLADHRRAGAGLAALRVVLDNGKAVRLSAMLRQSNERAARLSEAFRRLQELTGVPRRVPR